MEGVFIGLGKWIEKDIKLLKIKYEKFQQRKHAFSQYSPITDNTNFEYGLSIYIQFSSKSLFLSLVVFQLKNLSFIISGS